MMPMPFSLNKVVSVLATELPYSVLSWTNVMLSTLAPAAHVGEEFVIDLCKVGRDRRGTEEPFEPAFGEAGSHRLAVDEGNAVFLGDGADGQRDARLVGADKRDDLFFRDQAQRLVLADGGAALVVGEHDLDLGPSKAGKSGALGERKIAELGMIVVDDVDSHFNCGLGMDAGAGGIAAQGKDRTDLDGLLCDRHARQRKRHRGSREQPEHMLEFHVIVSKECARAGLADKPRRAKWRRRPSLWISGAMAWTCVLRTGPMNAGISLSPASLLNASTTPGLVDWSSSMTSSIGRPSTPPALFTSSAASFAL